MTASRHWELIDSGNNNAAANMRQDACLLDSLQHQPRRLLHFYDWQSPSATFGYFIDPSKYLNLQAAAGCGLEFARRPTGGGIIFHTSDFAFSILVPANDEGYSSCTLNNYAFINTRVAQALHLFFQNNTCNIDLLPNAATAAVKYASPNDSFCMAKPTVYDLIIDGRKIGGAAQRRTKHGYLHQGSISLAQPPAELLNNVLLPQNNTYAAMQQNSFFVLPLDYSADDLVQARARLRRCLRAVFQNGDLESV